MSSPTPEEKSRRALKLAQRRESVLRLHRLGQSKADIARTLDIRPGAVTKILREQVEEGFCEKHEVWLPTGITACVYCVQDTKEPTP